MDIYLVYCDFNNKSQSVSKVCELLNGYNGIRFQPMGWLIKTGDCPGLICQKIEALSDANDYVMITRLDDNFCCRQPENVKRWIRANI